MNIFVTGTDTNIGKTVVSTILALKFNARYWKPIQCGQLDNSDSEWVKKFINPNKIQTEVYRFHDPLSPHIAASNAGIDISISKILDQYPKERTVIEGAGGLLVPLNSKHLIVDLIPPNNCHLILVARSSLGTINHTLLSIEALRMRGHDITGVIMVGDKNFDNKKSIEKYGNVKVIGEIPFLREINLNTLSHMTSEIKLEI